MDLSLEILRWLSSTQIDAAAQAIPILTLSISAAPNLDSLGLERQYVQTETRLLDLLGTFRARPAEETVAQAISVGQRIGITRLANVTGLDVLGIPTWVAIRPLSRSLTVSQGKGISHSLAKASALMESIELYHAEMCVPNGIFESMAGALAAGEHRFVNPFDLPINRSFSGAATSKFEWIAAKSLLDGQIRYVPRHMICLDGVNAPRMPVPFISSGNGLASGNTLEEAMLHAVCEVIERDQYTFWLVGRIGSSDVPGTKLALDSVCDQVSSDLISLIRKCGLDIFVWYATTNIGLPVFACTIADICSVTPYPQRASGYGCHFSKRIALSRAITEAVQSRLTHITGSRDDSGWQKYRENLPSTTPLNKDWLAAMKAEAEVVDFNNISELPEARTPIEAVEIMQAELRFCGLPEILYVDLTQPELQVPVCHITVPGLEYNMKKENYTPSNRMIQYLADSGIKV